jgi:hypothetical protein
VFDEVMTSRMSSGGQQARCGVIPDLTTLGKYLAGGMTFGAFGGRADVMSAFDPARGGALTHGGTFNNNVVTMAAGAAAMRELLSADVLDALFRRGEELQRRLGEVFARSSLPLSVTGLGSLMSIHTVDGPVTSPRDLAATDPELKQLLFHELAARPSRFFCMLAACSARRRSMMSCSRSGIRSIAGLSPLRPGPIWHHWVRRVPPSTGSSVNLQRAAGSAGPRRPSRSPARARTRRSCTHLPAADDRMLVRPAETGTERRLGRTVEPLGTLELRGEPGRQVDVGHVHPQLARGDAAITRLTSVVGPSA